MPDALAGRDVLGRGQTGSGKTLAFGLPLLARLAAGRPRPAAPPQGPDPGADPRAGHAGRRRADAARPRRSASSSRPPSAACRTTVRSDALRRGVEVIVATPGRLGDLIERGACKLDDVEVTVLDEADQMADMGFLPEVTELLAKTPADAQRLLFSATLDGDVDALVKRFMHDPVTHSTAPAEAQRCPPWTTTCC